MSFFTYKDYVGSAEVSVEDNCIHGKIQHINDVVTYEAETVSALNDEFKAAVDDYLESCAALGKDPDRSFTGKTNVRMSPELHRAIASKASRNDRTLNAEIVASIEASIAPKRGRRQEDLVQVTTSESVIMGINSSPVTITSGTSGPQLKLVRRQA
jgi:predicted HicB family RNase H-like nuclease